jgi:hypothetical protein
MLSTLFRAQQRYGPWRFGCPRCTATTQQFRDSGPMNGWGRDKHKIETFYGCPVPFDGFFQHSDARARELHRQTENSYFHYLVSLSEAAAFCTGGASEG